MTQSPDRPAALGRLVGPGLLLLIAAATATFAVSAILGRRPIHLGAERAAPRPAAVPEPAATPAPVLPRAGPRPVRGPLGGDPAARHDPAARYRLPFDPDPPRLLLQGVGGSFSHTGPYTYSFDFQMPAGTLVLAARAGVVVRVIEIFTRGGPSPGLRDQANLVTVRHADGTFGEYVHLCPHCVLVREGDRVEAGQPLARSGQTGFTSEPHLHFMVWKATADGQFETVPIRFDDGSVEGFVPRQDLSYGGKSSPHP